jgi:hypothetical protein
MRQGDPFVAVLEQRADQVLVGLLGDLGERGLLLGVLTGRLQHRADQPLQRLLPGQRGDLVQYLGEHIEELAGLTH